MTLKQLNFFEPEQWRTQDFSMGGRGDSVTSHRDDVKILQLAFCTEVLKCIGL